LSKRHEESAHIQTLQRELAEAKTTSHTGIQSIAFEFPEIVDLLQSVSDLIYAADARSGAITDGDGRGGGNTLSVDGMSTAAGRSTYWDRKRLDRWRRNVAKMVVNIENELDPSYKRPQAVDKPQCKNRKCNYYNSTRFKFDAKFCPGCGKPLPNSERKKTQSKTRLTLVKHKNT